MGSLNKIKWVFTGLLFYILKKVLAGRIKGDKNKIWIQYPVKKPGIFNRVDFILEYCKNKNVLHIGCTDHPFTRPKIETGSLLHQNLKQVSAKAIGLDNNHASIEEYRKLTGDNDIYQCDIMQSYPEEIKAAGFDIVLLPEVLEHLSDPSGALEILHRHFNNGTKVLVTVPNYAAMDTLAASLNKTESIHPDHYWYFSPYTLSKLFNRDKFELSDLHFGMYYQRNKKINSVMKAFPYNGDCIIAIFSIKKQVV